MSAEVRRLEDTMMMQGFEVVSQRKGGRERGGEGRGAREGNGLRV